VFLGGDPESESVVNKLRHRQSVNHFLHECEAKVAVLQQREAALPTTTNASVIGYYRNGRFTQTTTL